MTDCLHEKPCFYLAFFRCHNLHHIVHCPSIGIIWNFWTENQKKLIFFRFYFSNGILLDGNHPMVIQLFQQYFFGKFWFINKKKKTIEKQIKSKILLTNFVVWFAWYSNIQAQASIWPSLTILFVDTCASHAFNNKKVIHIWSSKCISVPACSMAFCGDTHTHTHSHSIHMHLKCHVLFHASVCRAK